MRESPTLLAVPTIGENIRRLRLRAGFRTSKALAQAIGVPPPRMSDWENDRYALPDTDSLIKIAKGLRCSVDELLRGVDPGYDAAAGMAVEPEPAPPRFDSDVLTIAEELQQLNKPDRAFVKRLIARFRAPVGGEDAQVDRAPSPDQPEEGPDIAPTPRTAHGRR